MLTAYTIAQENALTAGVTPQSVWDLATKNAGAPDLQGFTTDISVNPGQVLSFKIDDTSQQPYHIDIYRLGYYGGAGARQIATIPSTATTATAQPLPVTDATTGLCDCGNWSVSATWAVPADLSPGGYYATSGIYLAKLVGEGAIAGEASQIAFIVRNDASHSDLLFQTSDATWQAYNRYGVDAAGSLSLSDGNSLYSGHTPAGRAYAVSYNRPITTRGYDANEWVLASEYPMVRFLEANGYDVSYTTDLDSDRNGSLITNHKAFLSVGHDEYWSGGQRANVEAALNAGVSLAFFSGNECFWKTRWSGSIDGSNTPYRTLVCYKETSGATDPLAGVSTGTWRDPTTGADGGRPENGLTGTLFDVNRDQYQPMTVPSADAGLRFWRNTSVATLAAGQSYTSSTGVLGFEWDSDVDNGARPAGLIDMSSTTVNNVNLLENYGDYYTAAGTATHSITLYRKGRALVFGAGTVQWSWSLDSQHDYPNSAPPTATDPAMRQATVNLLADMGARPATLVSGLVAATASTDTVAPTATISWPAPGAALAGPVLITGRAADTGGVVAGVEVSVDGGATWHPAQGRESWSYIWTPSSLGTASILARAVDDSGNLGATSAVSSVTVGRPSGPASIWNDSFTPSATSVQGGGTSLELGIAFTSDVAGYVTGVRFYKGTLNTGTHVGSLWSPTGNLLATANFTNETASGWQQVTFQSAVAIAANTRYVVSYHMDGANGGPVSFAQDGLYSGRFDSGSLHALQSVQLYATTTTYPTGSAPFNYWVDVLFNTSPTDKTAPSVLAGSPTAGANGVDTASTIYFALSEAIKPQSLKVELRDKSGKLVPTTLSFDLLTRTAILIPISPLDFNSTYTLTVSGGTDLAGNVMAPVSWSFTTKKRNS